MANASHGRKTTRGSVSFEDRRKPVIVHFDVELDDAGLDPYSFRICVRIARRVASNGVCFERISSMARTCRMSRQQVWRALTTLLDWRIIAPASGELKPGKTPHFYLLDKSLWVIGGVSNLPKDDEESEAKDVTDSYISTEVSEAKDVTDSYISTEVSEAKDVTDSYIFGGETEQEDVTVSYNHVTDSYMTCNCQLQHEEDKEEYNLSKQQHDPHRPECTAAAAAQHLIGAQRIDPFASWTEAHASQYEPKIVVAFCQATKRGKSNLIGLARELWRSGAEDDLIRDWLRSLARAAEQKQVEQWRESQARQRETAIAAAEERARLRLEQLSSSELARLSSPFYERLKQQVGERLRLWDAEAQQEYLRHAVLRSFTEEELGAVQQRAEMAVEN